MEIFSFLQRINEDLKYSLTSADFKQITLVKGEKRFFLKWLSDNEFIISLNFSIGTNYAFDIDHKAKSAIIVYGTVSDLTPNKTQVKLYTKHKLGLLGILMIPITCLFLQLTFDINIPLLFYIAPTILFFFVIAIFKSEEKRLIKYFKEYVATEKKLITTYKNNG